MVVMMDMLFPVIFSEIEIKIQTLKIKFSMHFLKQIGTKELPSR